MNGMELVVLHGTFVDEFVIELVLPLSIFVGLYWWSSRKEKQKKRAAAESEAPVADAAADRGKK